jgi:polar amino acid transport system substrate-binding protein
MRLLFLMIVPLATMATADAQQTTDPRVADLIRAGKLRVALFPAFYYTKDPVTAELRGVGIEVAHALSARLRIEVVLTEYPSPPKVVECLKAGACDVAFLGIDPSRIAEVDFSPPFLEVDFTYLVPAGSAIQRVADADRPGVRIAVVRNHAMDLALSRIMKQAEALRVETHDGTFDLLRGKNADVQAGTRPALLEYSSQLPGSRVLEDRYGSNRLAVAVPKDRGGRLAYVGGFIEEAKTSGLVRRAIENAGLRGIQVSPPQNLKAEK